MSTPGLLLLLFMSSCLSVLSAPGGTSMGTSEEGQLKHENHEHPIYSFLKKNRWVIAGLVAENIGYIPKAGPYLAGISKNLLLLKPESEALEAISSEIKGLDFKIDDFRAEMKWDAWAAGAYQVTVNNIERAWIKYTELERSYPKSTNTENEALKNLFFTFYSQYVDSTLVLHQFLTAKPASITQNLGDVLAARLRCHEKDVKEQFLYLNKLMCKGNVLNEKYYEFKGTNTHASVNTAVQIASQSASALIKSHQRCLSHSSAYIERDIFERIDDTKKHREIEDSVREFLVKTYDRYDWMVVAFTTKYSKRDLPFLNLHTFSGFTEVQRGTVTVAAAKQVKGHHTKAAAVKRAVKKCLPEEAKCCLNVVKKLEKCQETIFGKPLFQTFTAVHGYKLKNHASTNDVEAPDDYDFPESSSLPFLFMGKCGVLSKYMVFIKSDEELRGKEHLCSNVNCGENGKCVVVPETFIAMCECRYPYFGERCDMSLESYKRLLQQEPKRRTQTPEQFRKSKSVPPANRRSKCSSRRPLQKAFILPAYRRTPERPAQGHNIRSLCGSLCKDATTKSH
ncbi:uncharacterized protein [Cebidichthys violaceus]|uniref:uncharacterized protein n=1 Tax=Cebidichthys violaceus TaxID=271503 RepID=UPI0035C97D4A